MLPRRFSDKVSSDSSGEAAKLSPRVASLLWRKFTTVRVGATPSDASNSPMLLHERSSVLSPGRAAGQTTKHSARD